MSVTTGAAMRSNSRDTIGVKSNAGLPTLVSDGVITAPWSVLPTPTTAMSPRTDYVYPPLHQRSRL